MIHLVGPGGAGKSTVGPLLADLLGVPFHDLDASFTATHGSIDTFIDVHGYGEYAAANVSAYCSLAKAQTGVAALSSGFMVYPDDVDPRYPALRERLVTTPTTVVLLPALELEACVAETVRRQTSRNSGRVSAVTAEKKIRERFRMYASLPVLKVPTATSPSKVAATIALLLGEFAGAL